MKVCSMDIVFNKVCFSVQHPFSNVRKEILHSISGRFNQGELSIIMGPSGAGKSTFLNILARITGFGGSITFGGHDIKNEFYKACCIYIAQENFLEPGLTVFEALSVSAKLRLPANTTDGQRQAKILQVLHDLGLSACKDTLTTVISGSERKRLSIGLELVADPLVFLLDEPTTGLDMSSTKQCMKILKLLADRGKVVICTLHQPSDSIIAMSDYIYFLSNGFCTYNGPVAGIVSFLAFAGIACPSTYNPVDYGKSINLSIYKPAAVREAKRMMRTSHAGVVEFFLTKSDRQEEIF